MENEYAHICSIRDLWEFKDLFSDFIRPKIIIDIDGFVSLIWESTNFDFYIKLKGYEIFKWIYINKGVHPWRSEKGFNHLESTLDVLNYLYIRKDIDLSD